MTTDSAAAVRNASRGEFAGMPTISIDLAAETAVIAVSGPLDIMSSHLFADANAVAGVKSSVLVSFEACP
jgi:hypothetical protein